MNAIFGYNTSGFAAINMKHKKLTYLVTLHTRIAVAGTSQIHLMGSEQSFPNVCAALQPRMCTNASDVSHAAVAKDR